MTAKQREAAAEWIKANALAWGIGEASVQEIERLNIRGASHLAMQRALGKLSVMPDKVLVDGNPLVLEVGVPVENVIKGESKYVEIAAASVLAKVHRDAIMTELDREDDRWAFGIHKGYGTRQHMEALRLHGASEYHRREYAPVRAVLQEAA